ncbi:hypothetical protein [Aeromonas salmonicida]
MTDHKTAETTAFWDPVSWASCLGIGLLSTLLLVLAGSPLPYLLANGALALGAAVWNSHHYHNKQESRPHEEEQAHTWSAAQLNHSIIGLEQVCEKAVPIWSQQIENSRLQTEEAMIDLTQRFAGLTTKLEEAVAASHDAAGDLGGQSRQVWPPYWPRVRPSSIKCSPSCIRRRPIATPCWQRSRPLPPTP